tara:strand:- start:1076 stop:1552 length:477 start_codon:yes stop_codon:yes gene_type:complete
MKIFGKKIEKWHPKSGSWGIFGKSQSRKSADKAKKEIEEQIPILEQRIPEIEKSFTTLQAVQSRNQELRGLSELENFLNKSYDIRRESEVAEGRTGFANIGTTEDRVMKRLMKQRERQLEMSNMQNQMANLKLAQEKDREVRSIQDLISRLELEKTQY